MVRFDVHRKTPVFETIDQMAFPQGFSSVERAAVQFAEHVEEIMLVAGCG